MQEAAGTAIRNHSNLLLLSPTGSGKTLAYLLPIIDMLQQVQANGQILAVVVVPSRELALQVETVFKDQMRERHLPFRGMAVYGGRPAMDEHRVLREVKPEVLFATPGRLLDHISKENINVFSTKVLVLDEYDKCLELGFRDEMENIGVEFNRCPQFVLTSATLFVPDTEENDDNKAVRLPRFVTRRKFETVDFLATREELKTRIEKVIVPSPVKDKLDTLGSLLSYLDGQQAIVFVAHRESVERIWKYLYDNKFAVVSYHGGMDQDRRERALYRFRSGASNVLVSTDLAARGLDIPTVKAIIHYHLPLDEATYTHRTGRTARWEESGAAYLIVGPEEQIPAFIAENEEGSDSFDEIKTLSLENQPIKASRPEWSLLYIGRGKKDKLSRADILGFLCKKGGLTAKQIGRIDLSAHAAYAAVSRGCLKSLLSNIAGEKIKGMKTIIEEIRK